MSKCKYCRFWRPPAKVRSGRLAQASYGVCDLPDWFDEDYPAFQTPMIIEASAADDTNMRVDLRTRPDFACSAWELNGSNNVSCDDDVEIISGDSEGLVGIAIGIGNGRVSLLIDKNVIHIEPEHVRVAKKW